MNTEAIPGLGRTERTTEHCPLYSQENRHAFA
jgi:hypothetical protein